MKRFNICRLSIQLCAIGMLGISSQAMAAGFQIWEQDAASIGEFHAGYAALANNASTAFYNPAGITRIKNQQIMFGGAEAMSDFQYDGNISVSGLAGGLPQPVTAQGGVSVFIPNLHYVAPLTEKLGFGFSVAVPFGSKVDYGRDTILRYAVVRADLKVVDISPSFGYQVTDKFSVGAGVDAQLMRAQFDQVGVNGDDSDSDSVTKLSDTGYGLHLGGLYQYTPTGRVGLSYHSQVTHHLTGTSKFSGPLADSFGTGPFASDNSNMNITIPAYTALSLYQEVCPKLALMGSVIFTQWNVIKTLVLKDVAGIDSSFNTSTDIDVNDPQYFRNTVNVSVGANYFVTEKGMLRAGLGFDQTPTNNSYRNVQLPDNNRYVVALGGHYQTTKTIGLDLSWSHFFLKNATIHPPNQVAGAQQVATTSLGRSGSSMGGADVFGMEVIWDIA